MYKCIKAIIILMSAMALLGACSNNNLEEAEVAQVADAVPTATSTVMLEATDEPQEIDAAEVVEAVPTAASTLISEATDEPLEAEATQIVPTEEPTATLDPDQFPLPVRAEPRTSTSGIVPHVQIDVEPVPAVHEELFRRTFALPGLEDRPTIVSLPGARGMWLSDSIGLARPETIVSGREFAHIHMDGSLHAPLPYERALEVAEKGWGERHPWADEREGWDGFVMLFTPRTMEELDITFQLIIESYNHVTGENLQASDFQ